jgi:hypothetical protein
MPNQESKAAAELFERVGRALAGDAPDWQHHLADWLQAATRCAIGATGGWNHGRGCGLICCH